MTDKKDNTYSTKVMEADTKVIEAPKEDLKTYLFTDWTKIVASSLEEAYKKHKSFNL